MDRFERRFITIALLWCLVAAVAIGVIWYIAASLLIAAAEAGALPPWAADVFLRLFEVFR